MQPVAPYGRLAARYDAALGNDNFRRTRRAFEHLVRRHGIRFRTAVDLGCGTGMFARYLARCWRALVFAVDRSPAMLRVARCRARGEPVRLLLQDLRSLQLPCPVDLATANFDTVNHITSARDLRSVFDSVARHLRPGGHFVFDVVTPCRPLGGFRRLARVMRCAAARIVQRIQWNPLQRSIRVQVLVSTPAGSSVEEHRERAWDPSEVARWLDEAGFVIRGVYDAATLKSAVFCPPRAVIVAQRR